MAHSTGSCRMSTSDAGAAALPQQLTTAPPAHGTPRAARTATARSQHNETVGEREQPDNPHSDATPSGQLRHWSTIRKEGTHRVIILAADGIRRQEAAEACRPRFTTSLSFRLPKNQKVGVKLQPESDSCQSSLPDCPQRVDTEDTCCQVDHRTSPLETPAETAGDLLLKTVPLTATRTEELFTTGCNEPETSGDVNINQHLSNGDSGPHDYNGLHILPHVTHPISTCSGLEAIKKDIKVQTKVENQNNLGLSNAAVTMLSSTMVSVLAPHWTGRMRRTKRFEGIGDSEALGNFQVMASTATNHAPRQHGVERAVTERSQARQRDPFLITRSNTVEWSTKSDLARLDYESKRKMNQPLSLNVNSERMDNRKLDKGALSPVAPKVPSMSLDPSEQRRNPQPGNQGVHSALSSKPTTSSLLLSLRRMNSGSVSSTAASGLSEENHTARDQQGNKLTPHLSQSILNNNEKDRTKSVLSPQPTSYRTAECGPILPPSSSNRREGNMSESRFFSNSPANKDTEVTPFAQQPQTCSKPVFLSRGESVMQQNCRGSNNNTNIYPDRSVSSPRHSPYDTSALLKSHSLPRRTTLTSTSWWKQVTQEGSSAVTPNVTPSINDQLNTPLFSPGNDRSNLAMSVPSDNNRLRSQISLNRDNNNTAETVCTGNTNIIKETQGGTHLKERNARDSPEQKLDKQIFGSSLNNREPQKPHNVEDVLSTPKISRDAPHKTLTQPTNLSKGAVSNAKASESPPTFQNTKSSVKPTETNSKYMSDHCSSKTCITPITLHNNYSGITKQSLSTTSPNSQSAHFKTRTTPLIFERSYTSIPKDCPPKTLPSLITTGSAFSKTKYMPAPTSGSYSPSTTAPSPSLLTPPATPGITTSPTTSPHSPLLTPPATPILKSPSCLKNSSPKDFSGSPETDPKKLGVEGKKVRRVTWGDSVDSPPITVKKPDPPPDVPAGPLSSSRPPSVRTPSIFNFLRSSGPTTNTTPPPPKISGLEVAKGSKYRSLSSDADFREQDGSKQDFSSRVNTDHVRQDFSKNRQERTLSVESGTVKCHPSTSFSLPADFSSGYKLRYSSPPYSTLMSSRSAQGEAITKLPRSPLYPQASQSTYTPEPSSHADPSSAKTTATSKPHMSHISSPQTLPLPLQNKTTTQESSKREVSETDALKFHPNNGTQDNHQIGQVLLNRVDISSTCPQNPSSACVTETLVYSIKSQVNTAKPAPQNSTPKPVQHTANTEVSLENRSSQQPHTSQSKEVSGKSQSDHSSSGSSSAGSQSQGEESRNKTMKESMLSKSRFFSVESNSEQSPKRSRFALKKSVSTPSFSLSRSDSERSNKTNNKMDQVLNKLRQTFSTRRSEDDPSFPWKWKRASQTPSVSGSSDISSVSDVTVDSTKTLEEGGSVVKDTVKGTEETNRWTQNRYTIIPPLSATGGGFSAWSEKASPETGQDEKSACEGQTLQSSAQVHLTAQSPTTHQLDFFKDNKTDYKPTSQLPTCRDPSPNLTPNQSDGYATQFRKSTSSPRSPFSPFSSLTPVSLTPVSPFSSPDVTTDDSVFYSPKLQRRRESPSCDAGEGISLGSSRSRASTGPPSPDIGQDQEHLASSYADLKYGIVPGRSFSVSSVLSSRPSGPGRISTGSRFMSVGDLTKPSSTCSGNGKDQDRWSFPAGLPPSEHGVSHYSGDPGKMRSRSLPRSFSSCLSNWSSGVNNSPPRVATASKPAHLWGANVNICDFEWDVEGPPTPPPTPPLSPVSRRISTPPSVSSPTFPSPPGAPQSVESQSSRGHLPSRGYRSSLSTFEESSDSSSDTTTDDEYYLETGDGEEKETEL